MLRLSQVLCLLLVALFARTTLADWPFFTTDGPRRGSPEYYEAHAADPPGARQKYKYGKLWPPTARPSGPHQLFVHKFHHTHYWPFPYICQDRQEVATVAATQIQNGWIMATTLYDYHFDPQTNELNSSGKSHLRWILVHVPEDFRQVHVCVDDLADVTATRTVSVQRELARIASPDHSVPVLTRISDPVGRPASEVQSIFKSAAENMLPPILSTSSSGGNESSN